MENKEGKTSMVDETKVVKAEEPKKSNKFKIIIAAILALALAFGGFAYYKFVYLASPAYTLQLIGKSVKEHNVEEFNRHVDVKAIVGNFLDDQYEKDPSIAADPFAKMFWNALKGVATEAVQARVDEMVAGDEVETNAQGSDNPLVQKIEKTKDKKVKVDGVEKVLSKPDGTIVVKVKLTDADNKKTDVILDMKQLSDRTWQIFKVENLEEALKQLN